MRCKKWLNGFTLMVVLFLISSASAVDLNCGDTISADTVMTSDTIECTGNGIIIDTSDVTLDCDGFKISGMDKTDSGISTSGTISDITIINCDVNGFDRAIDMHIDDLNISYNELYGNNYGFYSYYFWSDVNFTALGNTIRNNSTYGLYVYRYSAIVINDNNIFSNGRGIRLWYSTSANIFNNYFRNDISLDTHTCSGLNVYENNFESSASAGLRFVVTHSSLVYDNNFSESQLSLESSYNNTFTNNRIIDALWGVNLIGSTGFPTYNNNFFNTVISGGEYGITSTFLGSHSNYFFDSNVSGQSYDVLLGSVYGSSNLFLVNTLYTTLSSGGRYLYNGWWTDVTVFDADGDVPLSNATIIVTDKYGKQWYSGTTDVNGVIPTQYFFDFNANPTVYYYSPYDITVTFSDYDMNVINLNIDENKEIVLYLSPISWNFDLNITQIDGYSDLEFTEIFSEIDDGTLTIDFEILSKLYPNVSIDINYSTTNVEGTGSVIANDLNAIDYCDDSDFTDSTACSYEWNISGVSDGNYYVNIVINNENNQLFDSTDDNFMIDNTAPVISGISINDGNNLDGVDYDLNATITDSSTVTNVTYKCYSNENEETCLSESWDCHLGNMTDLGGDNYGVHIDSSGKDKIGTWYCKIFAEDIEGHQSVDSESAVMDIILSVSVDAISGFYSGVVNSTENAIYTDQNKSYVTITNSGNAEVDVTLQATSLQGVSEIAVTNQKWSIADVYSSSIPFTGGVEMVKVDLSFGTFPNSGVFNLYQWLDIPDLLPTGEYTGIMVYGVSS